MRMAEQSHEEANEKQGRAREDEQGSPHAIVAVGAPLVRERGLCPAVVPQVYRVARGGELGVRPVMIERLETPRLAHPSRRGLRCLRLKVGSWGLHLDGIGIAIRTRHKQLQFLPRTYLRLFESHLKICAWYVGLAFTSAIAALGDPGADLQGFYRTAKSKFSKLRGILPVPQRRSTWCWAASISAKE